ncbi:tRNA glutamyl-Q(34) synthetase GluQRS [Celeribacter marinus]|uniref:Glutamyl-Q-tRNA synthetase n=1 Tax=Celeribacter marinus TaxID=1397108 RepID=A0A0P0A8V0_9RHOB|nr:tRNA glutamyl-Q(34) synthetase GluQRS [Celeribacter marinus]ALI54439.1 glutamyl-Q-tRNA synthetase [Celeribacter marinus]SFK76953.1 glutamyl-Q tRNA(Asp) synthetase [Celeribacter marinus]
MSFATRFAPSPTGPLHIGHAYSAMLGHQMARDAGGRFLLRMEDTDLERSKPEWAALIVEDLTWLGLTWDGPVVSQAAQLDSYTDSVERLETMGLLYPCSCTRADIRAALAAPQEGVAHDVYPRTCKARTMSTRKDGDALRLHLDRALEQLSGTPVRFAETGAAHAGLHTVDAAQALREIGDVVLSRKGEDIVAYFLASALDDVAQGITHVVRGEDLFAFTAIQVILLTLLDLPVPIYHHHALIRDEAGKRLAKRDDAKAISTFRNEGYSPDDIKRMVEI